MTGGIRATVGFSDPAGCPIAEVSQALDTTVHSIATSIPPRTSSLPVIEFVIQGNPPDVEGVRTVFTLADMQLCRVIHRDEQSCPCTTLGHLETPIARYRAENGTLSIVFHATDFQNLQTIITELEDSFPNLDIRRLIRSPPPDMAKDYILINRGDLTDRQIEVLHTAYRMGYFHRSREANAAEIAAELEIDQSTFREHLDVGLNKLLGEILLEG